MFKCCKRRQLISRRMGVNLEQSWKMASKRSSKHVKETLMMMRMMRMMRMKQSKQMSRSGQAAPALHAAN